MRHTPLLLVLLLQNMTGEAPLARCLRSVSHETQPLDAAIFKLLLDGGANVEAMATNSANHPLMSLCKVRARVPACVCFCVCVEGGDCVWVGVLVTLLSRSRNKVPMFLPNVQPPHHASLPPNASPLLLEPPSRQLLFTCRTTAASLRSWRA